MNRRTPLQEKIHHKATAITGIPRITKTLRLSKALLAATLLWTLAVASAQAQCVVTGPSAEGGEVVVCSGTDPDGYTGTVNGDEVTVEPSAVVSENAGGEAFDLVSGNNSVTILGGTIAVSDKVVLQTGEGSLQVDISGGNLSGQEIVFGSFNEAVAPMTVNISGGTLVAEEEVVSGSLLDDVITVTGGSLVGGDGTIQSQSGDDTITIAGGTVTQTTDTDPAVSSGNGNDRITVTQATIDATAATTNGAIVGGAGDDTIVIGNGAVVLGGINGDRPTGTGGDTDTLRFTHTVLNSELDLLCFQLSTTNPAFGSITINGLDYTWEGFEVLECALVGIPPPATPVPTLSVWVLVSLALLLAAVGGVRYARSSA